MLISTLKFAGQILLAGAGAYAVAYGLGGASETVKEVAKAWTDVSESTGLRVANG